MGSSQIKERPAASSERLSEVLARLLAGIPLEVTDQVREVYFDNLVEVEPLVSYFFPKAKGRLLECQPKGLTSDFLLAFGLGLRGIS